MCQKICFQLDFERQLCFNLKNRSVPGDRSVSFDVRCYQTSPPAGQIRSLSLRNKTILTAKAWTTLQCRQADTKRTSHVIHKTNHTSSM